MNNNLGCRYGPKKIDGVSLFLFNYSAMLREKMILLSKLWALLGAPRL